MRRTFFGFMLLGIALVAIAPLDADAGDWILRTFSWTSDGPEVQVVVLRADGPVNCAGEVQMTAGTCSGLYVIEGASLCSGAAAEDADEDEEADDDADD